MSKEEMVAVGLDNDYYTGAYVNTYGRYPKDYLVQRSQLERWEAATAAYEEMQSEIEQVMNEQRERVSALRAERRTSGTFLMDLYGQRIAEALRGPNYRGPQ